MIELTQLVSSKTAFAGDEFPIRLAQDLVIDGVVLAPAGATGMGEVVDAGRAGLAGRPGKLVLAARFVDFGEVHLPLRSFRVAGVGHDSSKQVAIATAIPYVGILAMGVQGGNIDYPAGTQAIAKVAADTPIPPINAKAAPVAAPVVSGGTTP